MTISHEKEVDLAICDKILTDGNTLSKISQTKTNTNTMIPLICETEKKNMKKTRILQKINWWSPRKRGWGIGEIDERN